MSSGVSNTPDDLLPVSQGIATARCFSRSGKQWCEADIQKHPMSEISQVPYQAAGL